MTRLSDLQPTAADSTLPLAEREQTLRGREWLTSVKHTPLEKADPLGWYQRALQADGVTTGIHVIQLAEANLSDAERVQVHRFVGHSDGSPAGARAERPALAARDWWLMVQAEQRVVTSVGLLYRVVEIGQMRVPVGAISCVTTLPEWRGRGHARAVLSKAAAFVAVWLWAPFMVAICPREETAFYTRIGWTVAEAPVWGDQGGGRAALSGQVAVYVSCQGDSAWPSGPIDVCGAAW